MVRESDSLSPCLPYSPAVVATPVEAVPLSIVVPCHNEAESLANLAAAMVRLQAATKGRYEIEWLFVDDGSTDQTYALLHDFFAAQVDVSLARHESNRGLAAAIQTGISLAKSELVASLDADCTYDPEQLIPMLAMLQGGVDLVVASPYHPLGAVSGVPRWRLALSQAASRLYRLVMRNKLHTYTSCVRVYRKSAVQNLPLGQRGFVGVVELLWQLDKRGGTIVECPATLTTRKTGCSKMRVAQTACCHLQFLARAAWHRLSRRAGPATLRSPTTISAQATLSDTLTH
jgi:dolichol-phosphate mannosyltransferase